MAAGERNKRRIQKICKSASDVHVLFRSRYGLDDNDFLETGIRQAYMDGLHAAVSDQVINYLEIKYGSQANIAAAFGLDRSTISKMKQNRSVPARYLELVVASNGFAMNRDDAHVGGVIEATYYVRRHIIKDHDCRVRMTEAEFTELACGQVNDWYESFILAVMEVEDFIQ